MGFDRIMYQDNRSMKALATALCIFFLLLTVLVSTHVHFDSHGDRDEATCPLCQLASSAVKFSFASKVATLSPIIIVAVVSVAQRRIVSLNLVRPSSIRGPPAVSLSDHRSYSR